MCNMFFGTFSLFLRKVRDCKKPVNLLNDHYSYTYVDIYFCIKNKKYNSYCKQNLIVSNFVFFIFGNWLMIYIIQWKLLYLTTMFNRNETYPNQNVFATTAPWRFKGELVFVVLSKREVKATWVEVAVQAAYETDERIAWRGKSKLSK